MKRIIYAMLPYIALPMMMYTNHFYGGEPMPSILSTYNIMLVVGGIIMGAILYSMVRIASTKDPVIALLSGIHVVVFALFAICPQIIPESSLYFALLNLRIATAIISGVMLVLFGECMFHVYRHKSRNTSGGSSLERSVYALRREQ